jgi:hypothetical protein
MLLTFLLCDFFVALVLEIYFVNPEVFRQSDHPSALGFVIFLT